MLPVPHEGLVVSYSYLWWREFAGGEESGRKNRPCAVVVAIHSNPVGRFRVAVMPITHQKPDASRSFMALPKKVKKQLKLDDKDSWIVCDEMNAFDWPGVDLAPTPDGPAVYGQLPDALTESLRLEFLRAHARGTFKTVPRTA